MKKFFYAVAMSLLATGATFAQKSDIRSAERLAEEKPAEARTIMAKLGDNVEPKYKAYAKYVSGLIEHEAFRKELNKLMVPNLGTCDTLRMYNDLMKSIPFFLETEAIEFQPNEKGKVKLKYVKKAKEHLKADYPLLINAGYYYIQSKRYEQSAKAFDNYLKVRAMKIFEDDKAIATADTMSWDAAYLAVAANFEGKKYEDAIRLAKKYRNLQDYKKDEMTQIFCASQLAKADTVAALETLELGASEFPKSPYYLGNLVNIYATQNKLDQAITFLTKALEANPKNINYLLAMGGLYERKEDWAKSAEWYQKILELEATNFDANHNLGRSYYNQAVTVLGAEVLDKLTEEKAKGLFKKALPYLESAYKVNPDQVYYVLANVYDRLDMKDKYEAVMAAHQ